MSPELLLIPVVIALFTLPGSALLVLSNAWQTWRLLDKFCLAVGISISLYPLLYYFARTFAPGFGFQPWMWWLVLGASAAVLLVHYLRKPRRLTWPDAGAWAFLAILFLTFVSRAWVAVTHPYPAWSDSLHHTLATALTAQTGRIPFTLLPYYDVPFTMYHLGLYALTGTIMQLAPVPAHSALLWTVQILNAFCILGVFVVLDRYVSRTAAVVGALTAGLLAHQPAFYVNWGRDTQLASQTILLIAWVMTFDTIQTAAHVWRTHRTRFVWQLLFAALATAGVFLLHFRVAAFYVLLLVPSLIWLAWQAWRGRTLGAFVAATAGVGGVALLLVSPILASALARYLGLHALAAQNPGMSSADMQSLESRYYDFGFSTYPYLVARTWLLWLALAATGIGLIRRNWITWLCLAWTILLVLLGDLYLLNIPVLEITNLGAILIMFYLPIALVMGVAVEELLRLAPLRLRPQLGLAILVLAAAAGIPFVWARAHDLEPNRYFVTDADVRAMDWIRANTPADAKFAVNTFFWLPNAPHGTDAGYWIPYFAQRATNAGVMISNNATNAHSAEVQAASQLVAELVNKPETMAKLQALGYDYVYIGAQGNSEGPALNAQTLIDSGYLEPVYQDGDIFILRGRNAAAPKQP